MRKTCLLKDRGVYLAVHLWANAVLAMVFNPRLMKQRTGTETPAGAAFIRDLSLSSNAAKQVCEQVTSAKLISAAAYVSGKHNLYVFWLTLSDWYAVRRPAALHRRVSAGYQLLRGPTDRSACLPFLRSNLCNHLCPSFLQIVNTFCRSPSATFPRS